MAMNPRFLQLLLFSICLVARAAAGEITVAAASDLTFALEEISARFQKQTGNTVRLTFGSSGNFFAQIQNGAPFDLFFSADVEYPRRLEAAGLVQPGSLCVYAAGKIVLWAPPGSRLDVQRLRANALLDPSVRKIAIANPAHAPYGRAAVAAMQHFQLYDRVRRKLVLGENISQAAQFVESGSADLGILALSLALAPTLKGKGSYWEIPADAYPRIDQAGVILQASRNKATAEAFLAYLKTVEAQAVLRNYGFLPPEKP